VLKFLEDDRRSQHGNPYAHLGERVMTDSQEPAQASTARGQQLPSVSSPWTSDLIPPGSAGGAPLAPESEQTAY
jgi:hypothetical protein